MTIKFRNIWVNKQFFQYFGKIFSEGSGALVDNFKQYIPQFSRY